MRTIGCLAGLLLVVAWGPDRTTPRPSQDPGISWRRVDVGVEKALYDVAGGGEGWCTRIVAVRIDPSRFRFRLRARLRGVVPGWSVDRAPADAVVAVNAGQFNGITPWGWLVMQGEQIRPPGTGPLSVAIAWDRNGRVHWLAPGEIDAARRGGEVVEALQSYPVLIDESGRVPRPIREPGLGVDLKHRDARVAIGALGDGKLVVAITRFNGLGPISPPVPLGLNLSEMAEVMRRLGCVRAVSLDGGVSAQLMTKENGLRRFWHGWRSVPLGLVAEPVQQAN
jgi:exopolysaccharide biosynthesis protein